MLLLSAGCAHKYPTSPSSVVAQIHNSDITWDESFIGPTPRTAGSSKQIVDPFSTKPSHDKLPEYYIPSLLNALNNADQFIAAHVLLTFLSRERWPVTAEAFNDLRVTVYAGGRQIVHEGQQPKLISKWNTWHAHQNKKKGQQ